MATLHARQHRTGAVWTRTFRSGTQSTLHGLQVIKLSTLETSEQQSTMANTVQLSKGPSFGRCMRSTKTRAWSKFIPKAFGQPSKQAEVTGLTFQPFSEVQSELSTVTKMPQTQSFARVDYHPECEAAMNEQINIEYTISYVYHAMHAFFDRDNVGLPGFASFFSSASEEERGHAQKLIEYQNKRGGKVQLKMLAAPEMEFDNSTKGEALYAMELALSLEKLNFQKLRALHAVADKHSDAALADFVEGDLLQEQVEAVKEHAVYVSQLRRVGTGLGVYVFDQELGEEAAA